MLALFIGFSFVITAFLVIFVLWPWLEHRLEKGQSLAGELVHYQQLIQERDFLLENLKELELDLKLEKIEPSDYERLKQNLLGKTAAVFEEIKNWEQQSKLIFRVNEDVQNLERAQ